MPQTHVLSRGSVELHTDSGLSAVHLSNIETGTAWALSDGKHPIFEIWLGDPAAPAPDKVLGSQDFKLSAAESSDDKIVFAGDAQGLYVELTISLDISDLTGWWLKVLNQGQSTVTDVVFPIISGLDSPDAGFGFTIPANNGFWLPYDLLSDDESLTWNYPIYGSMQYVDFGGKQEGIYIGCHDQTPLIKLMTAGKRDGLGSISYRFTDVLIRPGESLELPPIVISAHTGDWRSGADIYREWCELWMEKPKIPEWVLRKPHWAWMGMKGQLAKKPDRTYDDLPHQSELAAEHGVEVLQVASWLEHGHDTRYPDYVAGESLGGEEGMIDAVRTIHAAGHRMALYTNGRIADPESSLKSIPDWLTWSVRGLSQDHVQRTQKLHANYDVPVPRGELWDAEGLVAKEFYGIEFAAMCPSCKEWRDYFIDRIVYLAKTYGVDGVYLDQICGCWSLPCYAENHDHEKPNEAWRGYIGLMRELRARLKEINPEIYIATEGVGDIFGQFFDMLQGHHDWDTQVGDKARQMPELFRYTLPWLVVCSGPMYRTRPDLIKLAHLVGSGYDVCTMPPRDADAEVLARATKIMEWRERFADEMAHGEFLGPCTTDHPDYRAFAFRGSSRTVVTLAWSPTESEIDPPAMVAVDIPGTGKNAILLSESGEVQAEGIMTEGSTRFTIPFVDIGMLVVDRDDV